MRPCSRDYCSPKSFPRTARNESEHPNNRGFIRTTSRTQRLPRWRASDTHDPAWHGLLPGRSRHLEPPANRKRASPARWGIMVVGHNFDSEAGFARSHLRPGENMRGPTWRNLLAFLRSVNIAPEQCFFTNAYVGLVAGNSAVGAFPGARDPAFVRWCQRFLLKQFELMRPQLVLTLGSYAPQFLAHLSPELHTAWLRVSQLKSLDQQGTGLVYPVTIEGMPHPAAAVALTHPAYRPLNVRIRRYGEFEGEAAEQAMVCDAMTKVGL